MNVNWLIDTLISERNEIESGFPSLADAARAAGCTVHETKYIPLSDEADNPFSADQPLVVHGTHEFVRQVRKAKRGYCPGDYCREDQLTYAITAAYHGAMMLNDDFTLLPYAEMLRRFRGRAVFTRPNAVTKAYAGRLLSANLEEFDVETNALNKIERIDPDMIVVVAEPKDIEGEFRFVVADRQVVTGSEYRWDGKLDIRTDWPPECHAVAQRVAEHDWQPDRVYVCDVAKVGGGAKLIELNAFSCSGLYACDTRAIVQAVSTAALSEFHNDDC